MGATLSLAHCGSLDPDQILYDVVSGSSDTHQVRHAHLCQPHGSVTTRVVFTSKRMLPVPRKVVLSITLKSSVVYEYSCHCDNRYVGQTSQRLQDKIKQHIPKWQQQQAKRPTRSQPGRSCKLKRNNPDCDSTIGQHLLDNEQCAANYNDKRFKILAVARNSFHLCLLEATFIKTRHPVLCKQKEFVQIT